MQFPSQDLTDKAISSSYSDVLQKYVIGENCFILDGLGTQLLSIPSSSIGNSVITSDVTSSISCATSSMSMTSSYVIYSSNTVDLILNTTTSLLSIPTTTYNSVFINYLTSDGTSFRAGNLVVLYTTSSVSWNETTTNDIGDTNGLKLLSEIVGTNVKVSAINNTPTNFTIKYHYELL